MKPLERRVAGLFKKTHIFISVDRLRSIRDHYQIRTKELEKPPDLGAKLKQFGRFEKEFVKDPIGAEQKFAKLFLSEVFRVAWLCAWFEDECNRYPDGVWASPAHMSLIEAAEKGMN